MSYWSARTHKVATYGKRRFQVLARTDAADDEGSTSGLQKEAGTPVIEIYRDDRHTKTASSSAGLQFRVSSPARRRGSLAASPARPALVSRKDSNNEVQQSLVPKHGKGRAIRVTADDVDFETPPKIRQGSRLLVPQSSESSIESRPPGSPHLSKRLRSAKPPAKLVKDLSTTDESEGDEEEGASSQATLRPRARSLLPSSASAATNRSLLGACGQSSPIPFSDIMVDLGKRLHLSGSDRIRPRWTKMAEASYSEVFAVSTSPQKVPRMEDVIVVKVIPLRNGPVKRNEELVDVPQETTIEDAERELRITRLLEGDGFVSLKGAFVVQGAFPAKLLASWDSFVETRNSENVRPDAFPASQQYLLLCLPHCGVELETCKLGSWIEALSIMWQVTLSLAKAERSHRFEHRDLHWGNILVQQVAPSAAASAMAKSMGVSPTQALVALSLTSAADWPTRLYAAQSGVRATIIDYTLSRATTAGDEALFDRFEDEQVFAGEGDEQFEVYRQMRSLVKEDWGVSEPRTNLLWLLYLSDKLLSSKGIKTPTLPRALPAAPLRGPANAAEQARSKAALRHATIEKEAHGFLLALQKALEGDLHAEAEHRWSGAASFAHWVSDLLKKK